MQTVITSPFELLRAIFIAVGRSASSVLGYSWISFKHNVLGYYGSLSNYTPPSDFYLVMFKVVLWSLGVVWCFTTTTLRLFIEQINPPSNAFLATYTNSMIDTAHICTKEQAIDVSHVPQDVSVEMLRTFFDAINFTDPEKPGFMAPLSRQEDKTIYTVEELQDGITTFINNVKGRVPFLGTPPAYDTPRLMAFYQQIEDAIRFSIHKVSQDLANFQERYGDKPDTYDDEQKKEYKDLLEKRARLAIDMAIAGKHCGGRFMGEAMNTYMSLKGEAEMSGTLQDCLKELLATTRAKIAQKQVFLLMGSSTHGYSNYMASLGKPLGIPGTSNVIDYLSDDFDMDAALRLFFQEYTVDCIIDAVQNKIKKSQFFRENIIDWLKDQVGLWNQGNQNVNELVQQIQLIIASKIEPKVPKEVLLFNKLITHLSGEKITLPSENKLDDFVVEVFALDASKEWLKAQFPSLDVVSRQREKNNIIQKLKEESLGFEQVKIAAIRKIVPIPPETVSRVLQGTVILQEAVQSSVDLERRNEFINSLLLNNIEKEGVSSELLEWLLVSQEILLPQEVV